MIHFLDLSEDSSSSVLNQLQLDDQFLRGTSKDTIALIKSNEDKCMVKFSKILLLYL